MTEMTGSERRLVAAVMEATESFWAEIAHRYPEVLTGDVAPEEVFAWNDFAIAQVRSWLLHNGGPIA